MTETARRAIAIVGVGAVLPDAPNVPAFWDNLTTGRYSISETPKERWDPDHYYDPDPQAPDKSYTKIGGWVKEWAWTPLQWRLPIPPTVSDQMDRGQQWSIVATREALTDYGWPDRPLDQDRTAVILGNAMGGDKHYLTALRIFFPEYAEELEHAPHFEALPKATQQAILGELQEGMRRRIPDITEDTMPGELANIIAGRVANLFNFHGPNYIVDAACASAMAAITAAVEGLEEGDYDAVITGGVDANMSASSFVKFCKIGALSATGTRPYADGADGFVMGEGASIFLLKRLADAERDGDTIYAVLRGLGGSSDGKGKGITAPNPIGQRLAVERGWQNAGLDPATASMIEGHGTSTRVGDVIEANGIAEVFGAAGAQPHSIPLGSVKSNIGHLKAGAGAAGILKATLALHHKTLPPSLNFAQPNPNIDFDTAPFYVNTELRPWDEVHGEVRRAGVSAFGFGGTNFHTVLEEYVPGRLQTNGRTTVGFAGATPSASTVDVAVPGASRPTTSTPKTPLRGALVIGGPSNEAIKARLAQVQTDAETGTAPPPVPPAEADLRAPVRLAIDYGDAAELADKAGKTLKALDANHPGMWKALRAQGIFRGEGAPGKVAFLYTGQGSQYVNMLKYLRAVEPIVAETFAEADAVMTPILGKPLSEYIFIDATDPEAVAQLEEDLKQTEITQPAVLATDEALTRLLAAYGITPDLVMGHSLGEYGALVAAGALSFADALKAVSARGHAMKEVSMDDNGLMAAVFAPLPEVERILAQVDDYVVPANINSTTQAVIGGSTTGVQKAMQAFTEAGFQVAPLPVSHAFHTRIVAPASEPLRGVLQNLDVRPPSLPIVANVSGTFYPMRPGVENEMVDILARQVASPVQFVEGLETLYAAGARVFVETGPKKALFGFADDVLGDRDGVLPLFANHPKIGDLPSFNQALCGLYAAGLGLGMDERTSERMDETTGIAKATSQPPALTEPTSASSSTPPHPYPSTRPEGTYLELGKLFADFLDRGRQIYEGRGASEPVSVTEPVVITGAALGLPGTERVFDDANVARLLHGEQFIDVIPTRVRRQMVAKHITRLVKNQTGEPHFETIENPGEVIKLAGRAGALDLVDEFGFPEERIDALESTTRMATGAGLDALRDAGIPLAMRYKTTTTGSKLPERWLLPDGLRDDTGVIFASAFPGFDAFAEEMERYYADNTLRQRLGDLKGLRARFAGTNGHDTLVREIDRRIHDLETELADAAYVLDRKFLFRVLSMGHSQFAEYVGARGPNTQINAACASTTQAVGLAEDWIRQGRCRRVIVVAADNVTSDHLLAWIGAGFLATGAAATDEVVEEAALPFDKRRHGMIVGAGAAALVVESAEAARERGIRPITEVLSTVTANSAFHGTRLDVDHIAQMMEDLVRQAEQRWGISRHAIAPQTVFVSHETYTPARGGSAQAEVDALRHVFGAAADRIVIANTKGFTGHAMGAGIEDVLAVKALETGLVPPVANFKEIDPDLGRLNLSQGGAYPVRYALRLGAGFGSQISLSLIRWVSTPDGVRPAPDQLGFGYRIADRPAWSAWLRRLSGYEAPEIEVVQRTLRIKDHGPPSFDETTEPERTLRSTPPAAPPLQPTTPAPVMTAPPPPPVPESPAAPAPAAPEPAVAEVGADPVEQKVLDLVAEQTGYPKDMLDLDLDLEADLGIDTVKQAEMFAAVREAWGIERDETLQLRDFPTLKHVIGFVYDKRSDLKQAPPMPAAPAPQPDANAASSGNGTATSVPPDVSVGMDPVEQKVLDLIAEQTGYPKDMLDLDLDLEADLGIDTVKQAELFAAVRAEYGIERDENLQLRDFPTLAHTIQFVYSKRPDLRAEAPSAAPTGVFQPEEPLSPAEPSAGEDPVKEEVLDLVAAQTGYPKDMLDLDLDLEADLGIDTVKQAEMFANVRAAYDIPRDEKLQLRDFPTLADVIQFVYDRAPSLQAGQTPSGNGMAAPAEVEEAVPHLEGDLEAAASVPRRVPVPLLRLSLDLFKDTGVTLDADSRVLVMLDQDGVGKALVGRLEKRGVEVLAVDDAPDVETLTERIKGWLDDGPIHGVYWLPALDEEEPFFEMTPDAWREAIRVRVKLLYATMRALYDDVEFLVAATRLGGFHGYDEAGAVAPLGGPVVGFAKTFKRERAGVLAKAVDFAPSRKTASLADLLIDETLRDPGVVEVGYGADESARYFVGLGEQPLTGDEDGMALNADTVFVVTGAAGSIVSTITADLARHSGGTFYLLDLVPKPDPNDADLARFATDKDGLKRGIFERLKAGGERATPALVEKELAKLERLQAAQAAIQAVEQAGGTVHYYSVDLLDADAVAAVIDDVREREGRIDVLLHAAGLEISRMLPNKEPKEFDLVFDVKADGWYHLLHAVGEMPLGASVVFSSIAGRFGNAGQADYSAANDLLCKTTSSFRATRPATRGLAIDWTAWGEIGMASRGSIPTMMAHAGIDMLPPEAGTPIIRRELTQGGGRGEVVVAQGLGVLLEPWDATGGLALDAVDLPGGPMTQTVKAFDLYDGLVVEAELDPAAQPFLDDHRIDGTPVLPGVMGLEAFAEAAHLLFSDRHVAALEDVQFLAPFKFYRDEPRTVTVHAAFHGEGDDVIATCRLTGQRELPKGIETTTHFTATVRLTTEPPEAPATQAPPAIEGETVEQEAIYQIYFHGPAYQVVERAGRSGKHVVGQMPATLPANHVPEALPLAIEPRLVELCFQTAGVAEMGATGQMGLPARIARLATLRRADEADGPLYAVVTPNGDAFDIVVVNDAGAVYVVLDGYGTSPLPGSVAADALESLQAVMH